MLGCSLGGQALGSGAGKEGMLGLWVGGLGILSKDISGRMTQRLGEQILSQSGLYPCHLTTAGVTLWLNDTDQDIREIQYSLLALRSRDYRPLLWCQSWTAYACYPAKL